MSNRSNNIAEFLGAVVGVAVAINTPRVQPRVVVRAEPGYNPFRSPRIIAVDEVRVVHHVVEVEAAPKVAGPFDRLSANVTPTVSDRFGLGKPSFADLEAHYMAIAQDVVDYAKFVLENTSSYITKRQLQDRLGGRYLGEELEALVKRAARDALDVRRDYADRHFKLDVSRLIFGSSYSIPTVD